MGRGPRCEPGKADPAAGLLAATASQVRLLEDWSDQVEADLQRYHGVDLRDLWRPGGGESRLTYRRLQVLVDALPPEAATPTAIRDTLPTEDLAKAPAPGGWGPWSRTDHLLATVADRIAALTVTLARVNGGHPDDPAPIPRPGVGPRPEPPNPRAQAWAEAYVAYLRNHQGAAPPAGWRPDGWDDDEDDGTWDT